MSHSLRRVIVLAFCFMLLAVPLAASAAATVNVAFGATTATAAGATAITAQHFVGAGAWQKTHATLGDKMEMYLDPATYLGHPITVGDIQSIVYHTFNGGNPSGTDFSTLVYTASGTNCGTSWYCHRLTAEPYFSLNYAPAVNAWNTWDTAGATNQLTWYDQPTCGAYGFAGQTTTWADILAGAINWSSFPACSPTAPSINYASEPVKYLSFQTGSGWFPFSSSLDGITVTLTNGDVLNIDLEATATGDTWVDDDWATATLGAEVAPGAFFGFNAFAKVQDGINAVPAGNTVHVAAGTYNEEVTIGKSNVRLQGAGMDVSTIKGPKTGGATTVQLGAPGVVVDGFTITRDGNTVADWNSNAKNQGVILGANTTLQNSKVTGNRNGVYANNVQNVVIKNNVITFNRTGIQVVNDVTGLVIEQNEITNNWTMGILFNAFAGAEIPTSAITVANNSISGNWYGDVQSRFVGGVDLNVSGNWFGTTTPAVTATNSSEPGYTSQIPVEYGGSASNPGGAPNILGVSSAKIDFTPYLGTGADTNVETAAGRGTNGFQGDFASLYVSAAGAQTGAAGRIEEALGLVNAGGTIHVAAGTYTPAPMTVNKAGVKLLGAGAANTFVKTSGGAQLLYVNGAGFQIEGFDIQKTDNVDQNIITILGADAVVKNNTIHGQFVIGGGSVSRALELSGANVLVEGNTIFALRQPAYINNVTGEVKNNLVYGTKGWVLAGSPNAPTFTGNTWGTGNVVDIAVITGSTWVTSPNFANIVTVSQANNDAVIEDQRVTPRVLSVVYVNAAAPAGGSGGQLDPFNDLSLVGPRLAPGGKVIVVGGGAYNMDAGTHPGGIVVTASGTTINLNGATIGHGSPAFTINADDVSIVGPGTLDGTGAADAAVLVNSGADNFTLDGVEIKNWGLAGVLVDGSHASLKLVNNWLHDNHDGFHFTNSTNLVGVVTINGNLFKFNTAWGIWNESIQTIPAEYNAWGDIDGAALATGGDGTSGLVDADPFTFVEVFTDAALTPMNVVEGHTFTVQVLADAAGAYAAQYKLTYDPTLLQVQSVTEALTTGQVAFKGANGSCVTNFATAGTVTAYCARQNPDADLNQAAAVVSTITFLVAPDSSHTGQDSWTTYLDLKHADGLSAAARDGIKAWVNNAGFGVASSTDKDITDSQDGTINIAGRSQYTGYIDLQGRTNDSGATLKVYNQATISGATELANATSASSGAYTTAYVTGYDLAVGTIYYFQVDRDLYLPTTATAGTSWADFRMLEDRPLQALSNVVLLGGDATNNNAIDVYDASLIGGAYGNTGIVCTAGAACADVTGDGKVDILDLTLMGGNYNKTDSPWVP